MCLLYLPVTVPADVIPNRPWFRAQEVCEIASVQPYVLRGWEAEFPDLGVVKSPNGPRVYRRADVQRVLRLKHLIQVEGLTLSGARRRLEEDADPDLFAGEDEQGSEGSAGTKAPAPVAPAVDKAARAHLQEVRQGLQWILKTLEGDSEFALAAAPQGAKKRSRKDGGK
jgi:DNA-binding transcriptional MerR regulator